MAAVPTRAAESDAGENRAAMRLMRILDLFLETEHGVTLTDVSRRLELPKSTAHSILQTMRRQGYLTWDPATKRYTIGLRVMALARAAPLREQLQARARPSLEALAGELGETAILGLLEHDAVVYVDKVENDDAVRYTVPLGDRRPLHSTSIGKLFLAEWTDEDVRAFLRRAGQPRYTRATLTDPDRLLADLRRVRETGVAIDAEESVDGVVGVAAPVRGPDGGLLAGVAIVGGTRVNRKLAETQAAVARAVTGLSRALADR